MALLVIAGPDGKEVLVHSSMFGTYTTPARALGEWTNVWDRIDMERATREPPRPPELSAP
jgi:hypothetical protein